MAKLGVDKLVKEVLPEREKRRERNRKARERAEKKHAKEEADKDREYKALAKRWVTKELPELIKKHALAGVRKFRFSTSQYPWTLVKTSNDHKSVPDKYIFELLKELDDIRVTSDYYQGTGHYDEGVGYDESYTTYYIEWDEPE